MANRTIANLFCKTSFMTPIIGKLATQTARKQLKWFSRIYNSHNRWHNLFDYQTGHLYQYLWSNEHSELAYIITSHFYSVLAVDSSGLVDLVRLCIFFWKCQICHVVLKKQRGQCRVSCRDCYKDNCTKHKTLKSTWSRVSFIPSQRPSYFKATSLAIYAQ
jgi:hypothetical protein